MFEEIDDKYLANHTFIEKCSEMPITNEKVVGRFSEGDIIPKSGDEKTNLLRKKLSEVIFTRFEGNYAKLETACAINKDNVMKFINNKGKRARNNVSRNVLGKVCVGAKLSVEEAQELFVLQGFALDPVNNMFDAIVVCCLNKHDDIYEMIDMCQVYGVVIDRSAL